MIVLLWFATLLVAFPAATVAAQSAGVSIASSAATEPELLKWAMSNSPMAGVFVLALYVFRGLIQRMMAKDQEKITLLTELVGDCRATIATNTLQSASCQRSIEVNTAQTQQASIAINNLANILQPRAMPGGSR